ncbi:MAG: hypothetical protein ACRDD8_16555 [Bacteroidales bacterium]
MITYNFKCLGKTITVFQCETLEEVKTVLLEREQKGLLEIKSCCSSYGEFTYRLELVSNIREGKVQIDYLTDSKEQTSIEFNVKLLSDFGVFKEGIRGVSEFEYHCYPGQSIAEIKRHKIPFYTWIAKSETMSYIHNYLLDESAINDIINKLKGL